MGGKPYAGQRIGRGGAPTDREGKDSTGPLATAQTGGTAPKVTVPQSRAQAASVFAHAGALDMERPAATPFPWGASAELAAPPAG